MPVLASNEYCMENKYVVTGKNANEYGFSFINEKSEVMINILWEIKTHYHVYKIVLYLSLIKAIYSFCNVIFFISKLPVSDGSSRVI